MALEKIPKFDEVKEWAQNQGWITASEAPVQSVNGNVGDVEIQGVPEGIISMWSGSISEIPSGWALCDGTNGTPDLTDRFVAGAGGQYNVGDTGGSDEHTLTVDEMPSHTHPIDTASSSNPNGDAEYIQGNSSGSGGSSYDTGQEATGDDQPHENRPPYYALAYIMKI